jgi:hypothetical protein
MSRLLVVLGLLAVSSAHAQEREILFTARPLATSQQFEPSFAGVARVSAHRIEILLTRGRVRRFGPGSVEPGNLRAALATGDASTGLVITDASEPVLVSMHLRRGTDSLRDTVRLVIPRRSGQDLAKVWLLLEVEPTWDRAGTSSSGPGASFAVSTFGVLGSPGRPVHDRSSGDASGPTAMHARAPRTASTAPPPRRRAAPPSAGRTALR